MNAIIIGGCGHIGTYLAPRLVKAGYGVTVVTRGRRAPYVPDAAWDQVTQVQLDREQDPDFAQKIADMDADIVVDLINFHPEDTVSMVTALRNTGLSHYLFCSSIWAHGRAETLPQDGNCVKAPLDEYGKNKYASELYLKEQFRKTGFPATVVMPGQISGPGFNIISPYGNIDTAVFQQIADGAEIFLPNFGMETLHHVHAYDVAQMFFRAIEHRNQALGERFQAVEAESFTLYGYAKALYAFFGREPNIHFLSWDKWCDFIGDQEQIQESYLHLARSGHCDIEPARRLLGYQPKYTIRETVEESMKSYVERGVVTVQKRP